MTERTDKPGRHIVESAIAAHDAGLLRKIATDRKGLNSQQRDALLLMADLLDGALTTPDPGSGLSTRALNPFGKSGGVAP